LGVCRGLRHEGNFTQQSPFERNRFPVSDRFEVVAAEALRQKCRKNRTLQCNATDLLRFEIARPRRLPIFCGGVTWSNVGLELWFAFGEAELALSIQSYIYANKMAIESKSRHVARSGSCGRGVPKRSLGTRVTGGAFPIARVARKSVIGQDASMDRMEASFFDQWPLMADNSGRFE
jgi:hypothetical protein